MADAHDPQNLIPVVTLLTAAVVAVPLFRKLGLGAVLGYLTAGLVIGPFGLKVFTDPAAILHVAELGVVMFLFVIGLEMKPGHLWELRREIFGLGFVQIAVCATVLTGIGIAFGFSPTVSFVSGMGFVLTSTAIVMQLLGERGDIGLPHGQKMVSILLFEDLLIVPLLAIVSALSPLASGNEGFNWTSTGLAIAAVASVIAGGLWLLNPLFRILASARAREVMTAAALLVVLGTSLLMQASGLSMAMGAFLAGVLLAESSFRHQIEADIEPFRGILLGLFFIGVGMSLDLDVVMNGWKLILGGVIAMMIGKAVCIYAVARALKSTHRDALDRALVMAQGGEFAFVLFAAAAQAGVISAEVNANMTAVVVLSMVLTPALNVVINKALPAPTPSTEGVEAVHDRSASVLLIGFGRFGQVVSQLLLARNLDVTIIDSDPDMIRAAHKFGFKIYYGDGTRLDVLRAAGIEKACLVAVCIDSKESATRIVELVKHEFSDVAVLARSYDRVHARELVLKGVDYQVRETHAAAMALGEQALRELEISEPEIESIVQDIRRRDKERFEIEVAAKGPTEESRGLIHGNIPKPAPLIDPKRETQILNPEGLNVEPVESSK